MSLGLSACGRCPPLLGTEQVASARESLEGRVQQVRQPRPRQRHPVCRDRSCLLLVLGIDRERAGTDANRVDVDGRLGRLKALCDPNLLVDVGASSQVVLFTLPSSCSAA